MSMESARGFSTHELYGVVGGEGSRG
eukprot:COSAG05_NODE_23229_length_259_cov_0.706250_1_plen_25_part_01